VDAIPDRLDALETFLSAYGNGRPVSGTVVQDALFAIRDLMESVEILVYNFPELLGEQWSTDF
jgi:hypothetical protein